MLDMNDRIAVCIHDSLKFHHLFHVFLNCLIRTPWLTTTRIPVEQLAREINGHSTKTCTPQTLILHKHLYPYSNSFDEIQRDSVWQGWSFGNTWYNRIRKSEREKGVAKAYRRVPHYPLPECR